VFSVGNLGGKGLKRPYAASRQNWKSFMKRILLKWTLIIAFCFLVVGVACAITAEYQNYKDRKANRERERQAEIQKDKAQIEASPGMVELRKEIADAAAYRTWVSSLVPVANYANHWSDPSTHVIYTVVDGKVVQETKGMFDDLLPTNNGLPAGAWASTLVPDVNYKNLWRDPATRAIYRLDNGKIVMETNHFFLFPPEVAKQMIIDESQAEADAAKKAAQNLRQDQYLAEMRRANTIASDAAFEQRMANFQQQQQNQQSINEIQQLRNDYEFNSLKPTQPGVLKYNAALNRWEVVPQ